MSYISPSHLSIILPFCLVELRGEKRRVTIKKTKDEKQKQKTKQNQKQKQQKKKKTKQNKNKKQNKKTKQNKNKIKQNKTPRTRALFSVQCCFIMELSICTTDESIGRMNWHFESCAHSSTLSSVGHPDSTTRKGPDNRRLWWRRNVWCFTVAEAVRRANRKLPIIKRPATLFHHFVGTLVVRDIRRTLRTRLRARRNAPLNSTVRVNVVIAAATNWAAILWVLWRHTDDLYNSFSKFIRQLLCMYVYTNISKPNLKKKRRNMCIMT